MSSKTHELLRKYNVPGPRYTSYPTVPYWDQSPNSQEWLESIARSLDADDHDENRGAALYIHIPFCRSLCTYCGCNTRISRNRDVAAPYVQSVLKEWDLYLQALDRNQTRRIHLSEIHLGGGTPTFLSPSELETLITGILNYSRVTKDSEFSLEADPRTTTREQLATLARLGFRRLSLGIQDFDPKVQNIVHRIQSEEQVREVTETARELGYESINYDLIYGLPLQTRQSIENTIEAVMRLRPSRIAFYAYAHVPWIKPGQRRFTEADLPNGDEKRALYELGRELLASAGYREIGMDHFALESDSLWKASIEGRLHRNFMGYTSRQVAPLIGLGVSSIGDSWDVFAQNEKQVETYQKRIEQGELPIQRGHLLNEEDRILRRHILNLMTQFYTEWNTQESYTPYLDNVCERLGEFVDDELIELTEKSCRVTDRGRTFLRNICMAFDARLVRKAPETQLFSKTI